MTMTDDRPTMEQEARKHLGYITEELAKIERLRELHDTAEQNGSGLEEMLEKALEEAEDEMRERPYGVSTSITVEVELYGGGPAGGIHFECTKNGGYLEWHAARMWHQDWFQPKGWVTLDDDTADTLWNYWGLESLEVE